MWKYVFAVIVSFSMSGFVHGQEKVKVDTDQNYVVLSTKRIQTMEKELDEIAAKGFRIMYGAPTQQYDMALLLKRVSDSPGSTYSYKILATSRQKTMEKEMNDLALQGYRLLPRTIIFKQGFLTGEIVMIMEKAPNSTAAYEYDLLSADKESKLHKKIDEAIHKGFQPATMLTIGEHIVVMEKEIPVGV